MDGRRDELWEAYTSTWSEPDPATRLRLLEKYLSADCEYCDPRVRAVGYDELSGYMAQFQQTVPGGRFATTAFREHHDQSLAGWNMLDASGRVVMRGTSFAVYAPDGRLRRLTGFFEPPETK